ncbi:hypothetical protein [Flavobacterium chungangensis]|uniref:Uncharacterized protein n=1 Tax=Flavobacterium chungangensis TaxID=2708132 RepID=A0ABV8ZGC5_9FLAO
MLSILLIYWIWKPFANLAIEYDKNKWMYFLLGLLSYFFFALLFCFLYIGLFGFLNGFDAIDQIEFENIGLNLLCFALGALGCYGVYEFLKRKLQKQRDLSVKEGIENIGVLEEN